MNRVSKAQNKFFDSIRSGKAADVATQPGTASDLSAMSGAKYALFVSFKKDGSPVPTPVWFGLDGGKAYLRAETETAKVKRVRRDPHVRVGPCDIRGKPKGPLCEGTARILPPDEEEVAEHAIQSNYGAGRKVFEGMGDRMGVEAVYIEVTPTGGSAA